MSRPSYSQANVRTLDSANHSRCVLRPCSGCVCTCNTGYTGADCGMAPVGELPPELYIVAIADPNDNLNARFVEIFNPSCEAIDFGASGSSTYKLGRYTNGNTYRSTSNDILLSGSLLGRSSMIICATSAEFQIAYDPLVCNVEGGTGGPVDSNGDDNIVLIKDDIEIDIFGVVGEDGTNGPHEFEDGQARRIVAGESPMLSSTSVHPQNYLID